MTESMKTKIVSWVILVGVAVLVGIAGAGTV